MLIEDAIALIYSPTTDGWGRLQQSRKTRSGLELTFSVHQSKRGKRVAGFVVLCRGVHEAKITNDDYGGMGIYPSDHPAARQYSARRAVLRWPSAGDQTKQIAALYRAHVEAVDDWISFDQYLLSYSPYRRLEPSKTTAEPNGGKFVCNGPDFLLRAYAKALRSIGEQATLTIPKSQKAQRLRPKVLQFGSSYVVADAFSAQLMPGR
jgi:hypothetical protein